MKSQFSLASLIIAAVISASFAIIICEAIHNYDNSKVETNTGKTEHSFILPVYKEIEIDHLPYFLDSVRVVETGGEPNPSVAVGSYGEFGPFQITQSYLEDTNTTYNLKDCGNEKIAIEVMMAYWSRWCPDALKNRNFEILARVHNGGPRGHFKESTKKYWVKVKDAMNSIIIDSKNSEIH